MDHDSLTRLLSAAGERQGNSFRFGNRRANLLIAQHGAALTVERVREVCLEESFARVENDRCETYFLDPTAIVGLSLSPTGESGAGGAGFVSKK